jgi:hypothetical protein
MQEKPGAGERLSGVVVVLLDEQVPPGRDDTLLAHARRAGLDRLVELLLALGDPPTERLVTSVAVGELLEAERARLEGPLPPLRSLARYWRVDVDARGVPVEAAVARLRDVPGVALAYGELVVTEPSSPVDPHLADQRYLQGGKLGVDALAAWTFRGGRGEDVALFDIEQAWRLAHDDIAPLQAALLCNTNRDGRNGFPGDHGNATLGVVAARADTVGVVGIAHGVASVSIASHYKTDGLRVDDPLAVADALTVVGTKVAPGDVVLVEASRAGLPVEAQLADFDAIRFVAGVGALGAVVVEPAGNGDETDGVDLDVPQGTPVAGTQWWATRTDDSGAVLVGAARSQLAGDGHECRRESNFGTTVHCHAWGDQVFTAAAAGHMKGYGGTSAASAIVAGVAACLQGMHRAAHGAPLAARDVRVLLADPASGTPQHLGPAKPIGPMPDLAKLAAAIGAVPGP